MKTHQVQQLAITASLWALILSVESKSAVFAFFTQDNWVSGLQFAAITLLGAILAALCFTTVGQMKADERPDIQKQAGAVRVIGLIFLSFPVWFFGSSVKLHNDQVAWDAYSVSVAYEADQAVARQASLTISERTVSDYEMADAIARTVRPTNANLTPADGELWFALILLGLLNFAAEKLRVPAPITAEERQALMFKERGRKAAETRARNAARRAAAKKAREPKRLFGIVVGGKA